MSGERGEWSGAARAAAEAVAAARDVGEQLGLFGDPEKRAAEERRKRGRPEGSRNKGKTGLAEYMAAQGWRAPGHAVALAAGLAEDGDGLEVAFRRAQWLRASAIEALVAEGADGAQLQRMVQDVLALTLAIWREQNAAAAQLLPYTLARLAPLEGPKTGAARPMIGIAPPGGGRASADAARVLAPADVRMGFQGVGDAAAEASDDGGSDDDASD